MNRARVLERAGRALFAVPFVAIGLGHFANAAQMATMVPRFVPAPTVWVYVTGLVQIGASVSIGLRKRDELGGALLGALLLAYVGLVHVPAMLAATDDVQKMVSMGNVLKDIGLAGAALFVASGARAGHPASPSRQTLEPRT